MQGNRWAQLNLGLMYDRGQGVEKSDVHAALWLRKAAEQGVARAQNHMARLYADGRGVPRDPVAAHTWFDLAVRSLPPGEVRTAAANDRDSLAREMTAEQVAEAQRRARQWMAQRRGEHSDTDVMIDRE